MDVGAARRWLILALGLFAQTSTCVFLYGIPMLVPALREPGVVASHGLSLAAAGALVAAPSVGLLLTLIGWGAAADRYGERWVITTGLTLSSIFQFASVFVSTFAVLFLALALAGAAGASVNAASGRMVLGWFPTNKRGLAMGIRQTAQPLGVGIAALVLPSAGDAWGALRALLIPAVLCAVAALLVATLVIDPPRVVKAPGHVERSPYREPILWRIHAASAALVVPQFAISAYTLAYLVSERHWAPIEAGRLVFALQIAGAAGRIGAGVWSDRAGSRLRPMRILAVASAGLMVAIAVCDLGHLALIIGAFAVAAVVTVADNGLAYTSVAELAGPFWAGRALGAQNTGQNVAAALTPPLLGAVVQTHGYTLGFLLIAIFPVLAIFATPVRLAERRTRAETDRA
jgi:sugar phosphate permease